MARPVRSALLPTTRASGQGVGCSEEGLRWGSEEWVLDRHSADGGVSLEPSWEVTADLSSHRTSEEAEKEEQDFSERAVAKEEVQGTCAAQLPSLTAPVTPRSGAQVRSSYQQPPAPDGLAPRH